MSQPISSPDESGLPVQFRGRRGILITTGLTFIVLAGVVVIIRDNPRNDAASVESANEGRVEVGDGNHESAVLPLNASAFDKLDPKAIPARERFSGEPVGLVAVLGSRKQRSWFGEGFARTQALAVRPDGGMIAYRDAGLSLLHTKTGGTRWFPTCDQSYLLFSADGTRLLAGFADIWDVTAAEPRKIGNIQLPDNLDYHHSEWQLARDGKTLIRSGGMLGVVMVLDWSDRDNPVLKMQIDKRKESGRVSARVSGDGKTLACYQLALDRLEIYDIAGKEPTLRCELNGPGGERRWSRSNLGLYDFHPDGRLGVIHADGVLRLWDVGGDKPKLVSDVKLLEYQWSRLYFVPGGQHVIFLADDGVHLMKVPEKQHDDMALLPGGECVWDRFWAQATQGFFSTDGKTFVTSHRGAYFTIWEISEKGLSAQLPPLGALSFAIPADPNHLVVTQDDNRFRGFRLKSGGTAATVEDGVEPHDPKFEQLEFPIAGYVCAKSEKWAAILSVTERGGREVSIWDITGERPKRVTANTVWSKWDHPVYLTTDGRFLISNAGGPAHDARLWRIAEGSLTKADAIFQVASPGMVGSPDGKLLAFGNRNVFDISEGRFKLLVSFPPRGHHHAYVPAFSPDGKWVAFCGEEVTVYDWATRKLVYSWRPLGATLQVGFSRDGRHLVTRNTNGTIFVIRLTQPPKE